MKEWLIAPIADRTAVRKMLRAIDVALGYPRTEQVGMHGVRQGPGRHGSPGTTVTQCDVWVNLVLGAIAVRVDDTVRALRGRQVAVDAESVRIRVDDAGWQLRASLPGNAGDWSRAQPRDGGAGSQTGEPVP
jgi:hypothetical protein